ncbi:hypothetical protein [Arthrobacter pigmenti]
MADWKDITNAIGVALGDNRTEGGQLLMACWENAQIGDHPQRCVLAHYLADLESDLDREIAWDERALAEHAHIGDGDLAHVGISSALGMKPSLHLNLGDGYLRRGDKTLAWEQLEAGLDCAHALKPDGYGVMIRNGLDGLEHRIQTMDEGPA